MIFAKLPRQKERKERRKERKKEGREGGREKEIIYLMQYILLSY